MKYEKDTCFDSALDYGTLLCHCEKIAELYPGIRLSYIGNSLLSRKIPMLCFGREGAKAVFYAAGHHASEWLCSCVLLRFAYELGEYEKNARTVYGASVPYLCKSRRICILPQLNVDGCEIEIHGADPGCPTYERLVRANGGSEDFSLWQANARGVDLNHNYNCGFEEYKALEKTAGILSASPTRYSGEYPESEPEVAAVCNFLRYTVPALVLSLHSQGEVIYGGDMRSVRGGERIGERLAQITGYTLDTPRGPAAYGGMVDWYTQEMHRPAYTLECGKGKNPLPLSDGESIYRRLRRALFTSPMLV